MDLLRQIAEAGLAPSHAAIIIGLLVVLLVPVILHLILSSTRSSALPSVLLLGPSGSGKTALLTLCERGLSAKEPAQTRTSLIASSVALSVPETGKSSNREHVDASESRAIKFLLVDTPGHPKLRGQAFSRLSGKDTGKARSSASGNAGDENSKVKAIIFMVDAAALGEGGDNTLAATAEYLHDVLLMLQKRHGSSRASRSGSSMSVLVAANKLDLFTALPAALVRASLEAEITRIRKTRSKGLLESGAGADDVGNGDDWLGEFGNEKFTFNQMLDAEVEVDVVGGSVMGDGPGADDWWTWLAEKM